INLRGSRPLVCCALAAVLAGCSQSAGKTDLDSAAGGSAAVDPDKVVAEFLQALRTGNEAKASSLLTPTARQKTADAKLEVGLPASPSASFEVGEVELVAEDGAHVASTWTDVREDSEPRTDRIVWILRKETEGWRVAGMAIKIFDDQQPLILNFE